MVNAFQGLETESLGKLSGSVKVCKFCGLQSAREKLSAYQSETAFPKTEQEEGGHDRGCLKRG